MVNNTICNLTGLNDTLFANTKNCSRAADIESSLAQPEQRLLLVIPLVFLALVTSGGNVIVMICTRIDKRLRTVSSLYVFSLATADLIVGFAVMGPMTVYTINGMWPLGIDLCTTWMVFDFSCCTISMLHLCLVAHDRYVALVHPMEYKNNRTTKDALTRIVLAWIVGALAWIPCIAYIRYDVDKENIDPLDCFFTYNKWFVLIQSIVVYYTPIVAMCSFYVACLHMLRLRYKKTAALGLGPGMMVFPGEGSTTGASGATAMTMADGEQVLDAGKLSNNGLLKAPSSVSGQNSTVDEMKVKKKVSRQQQQLRSIRTLGLVIVVFLFCWIPFCSFWPISAFCPDCISLPAYEYSYWAAYLNSTVNPALYFVANRDFRNAFRKLIRWKSDDDD